jgi:hypothetical protein
VAAKHQLLALVSDSILMPLRCCWCRGVICLALLQVFGIVAIQLLVTVGFACVCLFVPEVKVSQQQFSAAAAAGVSSSSQEVQFVHTCGPQQSGS